MPVNPTYPGVYIEEVPSGVRPIVGVATSVTAFVGPATKGPVDSAATITSWGDFERQFRGLSTTSPMSYAVNDFFQNGGTQAVIVRIAAAVPEDGGAGGGGNGGGAVAVAASAKATATSGELILRASSPGAWGNGIAFVTRIPSAVAEASRVPASFDLWVRGTDGAVEQFNNLSSTAGERRAATGVLALESALVEVATLGVPAPAHGAGEPALGADPFDDDALATLAGGADGPVPGPTDYTGSEAAKTGLWALTADNVDIFNLVCLPPPEFGVDQSAAVWAAAAPFCQNNRAFLIVDPPAAWDNIALADIATAAETIVGVARDHAAVYFPRIRKPDQNGDDQVFGPSGSLAGVMARTDAERGVWKAPAGLDAGIVGIRELTRVLNDRENGLLNPRGINVIRPRPSAGTVVWGARTGEGADELASEWKYVPVRRTALFIEESLYRGTQWAVFEPNDEPLWGSLRLNIEAFMHRLFRQGAFQGSKPKDAYLVKVDAENNPQSDIDLGIVNILVGFAPLKPAEFVIIKIQQLAGQTAV